MEDSGLCDQVFESVFHPILSFLSVRDAIKCYLLVNKRAVQQVTQHFLVSRRPAQSYHHNYNYNYNYNSQQQQCHTDSQKRETETNTETERETETDTETDGPPVVDGTLSKVLLATELVNLLYNFMRIVTKTVMFPVSEKSKEALQGSSVPGMFCTFGDDLHTILAQVFTQWFAVPGDVNQGVLMLSYEAAKTRMQSDDQDDRDQFGAMKRMLEQDVQYWYHHRVFDSFIVLFERSDGTIMISEDLKRVYLVVDIDLRISYKCTYYWTKDMNAIREEAKSKKPCLPFGPIYGKKVTLILLPFKNMIITDGSIFHSETLTGAHIKEAVKAYQRAMDTNTLITTLPKTRPTLHHPPVIVDSDLVASQRLRNFEGLKFLRSMPQKERSVWWFIEEEETVDGVETIVVTLRADSHESSFQIDRQQITANGYIDALCAAVRSQGCRCGLLFVPNNRVFVLLQQLLENMVNLQFQADPCQEELYHVEIEEKLKCKVCKCSSTPTGKKVLRCTKCNKVCYCCQEHQREDWIKHKKNCGK